MNRRSFMQSILAAGIAPYVCTTAGVLMPVRGASILLPDAWYTKPQRGSIYRVISVEFDYQDGKQTMRLLQNGDAGEPVLRECSIVTVKPFAFEPGGWVRITHDGH